MKPMFLPAPERNTEPSVYTNLIRSMRETGLEYPQI